jgi:hypothetical protein
MNSSRRKNKLELLHYELMKKKGDSTAPGMGS